MDEIVSGNLQATLNAQAVYFLGRARQSEAASDARVSAIRAHNKAVRYMIDPAHRMEVSQMLADASRSSLDDALKTWDVCMQVKAFVPDGAISDAATVRVRDTLLASGDLKTAAPPGAYLDRRFMEAVAK